MSAAERWAEATYRLVETGVHAASRQCVYGLDECLYEGTHRREAREVLTALAEAGLLLQPGGESREEYDCALDPHSPHDHRCPDSTRVRTVIVLPWRPVEGGAS